MMETAVKDFGKTPSVIRLNEKQKKGLERIAAYTRRAALKNLDDMENIHKENMKSFAMTEEARRGFYRPVLSTNQSITQDLLTLLDTDEKAESFYRIQKRISDSNFKNKGHLDGDDQLKEIFKTQETMSVTNKILDLHKFKRKGKKEI